MRGESEAEREHLMASWKELPVTLGERERRLVVRLRGLKDHSGLSLAGLSRRTSYSSSSWERYLNGKKFPPPEAVRELSAVAGVDPERLLALHALAVEHPGTPFPPPEAGPASSGGDRGNRSGATSPDRSAPAGAGTTGDRDDRTGHHPLPTPAPMSPADSPDPGSGGAPTEDGTAPAAGSTSTATAVTPLATPGPRRGALHRRPGWIALAVVMALLPTLLGLRALTGWPFLPWDGGDEEFVFEPGRAYGCTVHRRDGLLYAGHGESSEALLYQLVINRDVLEVQCLLDHHGFPPGPVDGAYDALTERAVKRFQEDREHLVVDGIVGPHTWEELRR
ncbi:peptidoglycan-binding protein [Streptomyces sp. ST2-7A]|uniref:peptidoglycan-binding domain-containing protein n=1 Tax=Streptomyces sp. ST2-7A TaxID=2907214 RepID=UPI001F1B0DF8|nr:peptidoglycan-binding domain-containing protein [Streptomyces sp. ST2-7A]MCE7078664.1 peptidoglycan-binding protein [Streptomyces sp. ST2-7A]